MGLKREVAANYPSSAAATSKAASITPISGMSGDRAETPSKAASGSSNAPSTHKSANPLPLPSPAVPAVATNPANKEKSVKRLENSSPDIRETSPARLEAQHSLANKQQSSEPTSSQVRAASPNTVNGRLSEGEESIDDVYVKRQRQRSQVLSNCNHANGVLLQTDCLPLSLHHSRHSGNKANDFAGNKDEGAAVGGCTGPRGGEYPCS